MQTEPFNQITKVNKSPFEKRLVLIGGLVLLILVSLLVLFGTQFFGNSNKKSLQNDSSIVGKVNTQKTVGPILGIKGEIVALQTEGTSSAALTLKSNANKTYKVNLDDSVLITKTALPSGFEPLRSLGQMKLTELKVGQKINLTSKVDLTTKDSLQAAEISILEIFVTP